MEGGGGGAIDCNMARACMMSENVFRVPIRAGGGAGGVGRAHIVPLSNCCWTAPNVADAMTGRGADAMTGRGAVNPSEVEISASNLKLKVWLEFILILNIVMFEQIFTSTFHLAFVDMCWRPPW